MAFRARPSRSQTRQPRTGVAFSHVIASGIAIYEQPCSYSSSALSLSQWRQLSTRLASTMRNENLVAPRNSCAAHVAFSFSILQLFKSSYGVLLYRSGKLEIGGSPAQINSFQILLTSREWIGGCSPPIATPGASARPAISQRSRTPHMERHQLR
jgi:hypothetical protein